MWWGFRVGALGAVGLRGDLDGSFLGSEGVGSWVEAVDSGVPRPRTDSFETLGIANSVVRGCLAPTNKVGAPRVTPVGLHASFAASSSKCA